MTYLINLSKHGNKGESKLSVENTIHKAAIFSDSGFKIGISAMD